MGSDLLATPLLAIVTSFDGNAFFSEITGDCISPMIPLMLMLTLTFFFFCRWFATPRYRTRESFMKNVTNQEPFVEYPKLIEMLASVEKLFKDIESLPSASAEPGTRVPVRSFAARFCCGRRNEKRQTRTMDFFFLVMPPTLLPPRLPHLLSFIVCVSLQIRTSIAQIPSLFFSKFAFSYLSVG